MGDIADWMLSSEDMFPDPFKHDDEDVGYYQYRSRIRCRYCRSTNVHWSKSTGKWRLFTGGQLHKCSSMPTLKD